MFASFSLTRVSFHRNVSFCTFEKKNEGEYNSVMWYSQLYD